MRYLKPILFFCAGLFYSLFLTLFGVVYTGMGHGIGTGIFWRLALLPIPLVYWAIIGVLLCWRERQAIRFIVAGLVIIHYLSFIAYLCFGFEPDSRYEDFSVVWQRDPFGIVVNILIYLAGQILIWTLLFFREKKR